MTDGSPPRAGDRPPLAEQRDLETVYQPAEDSRLLAENACEKVDGGDLVVDVGTGSGYVAATIEDATGAQVVGIDVNPHACAQARSVGVPVVRGSLLSPFRDDCVDVAVCNPPYLPTPADVEWDDWMEAALSGGPDGRTMVAPFLETVGRVLGPDGRVYLLISTLTDQERVTALAEAAGFAVEVIATESYPFENLLVLELTRPGG